SPAVSLRALSRCAGSGGQEAPSLIRRLLEDCYQAARLVLKERSQLVLALSERLLEAESLAGPELEAFFEAAAV
ncbi:MAG: hypothetical protein IJ048_01145, partial [Clostridia bacterium]|nr:hypothetical protein [Clostridia bacterium]